MLKQQCKQLLNSPIIYLKKVYEIATSRFLPKKLYLRKRYKQKTGKILNLENPKTFNEKLQWLKLYYRNPLMSVMADKFQAREYVKEKVGEEILIPLYRVFNHYNEIIFDELPEQFALKATHGSGWNIICKDKQALDWNHYKYLLKRYYHSNMYYINREWPYKNIKPRFICERLLLDEHGEQPTDYKFWCFNGEPKIIDVIVDRSTSLKVNFYDINFNRLSMRMSLPTYDKQLTKPDGFEIMVQIATQLSKGFPFVRVDLYNLNGKIYFGELTFYPTAGYAKFRPEEWDNTLGSWLELKKY